MTCGIYCIENIVNGKKYIGQSIEVEKRWSQHKTYLNKNKHPNVYLQNSWNKYGKDNFKFFVLEKCSLKNLSKRENYYINKFDAVAPNGYNLTDGGEEGSRNLSDKTREKMSNASRYRKRDDSSSKYFGVTVANEFYHVQTTINGKLKAIGIFDKEEWAAMAYDIVMLQLVGNDCKLNFPEKRDQYLKIIENNKEIDFKLLTNRKFKLIEKFKEWKNELFSTIDIDKIKPEEIQKQENIEYEKSEQVNEDNHFIFIDTKAKTLKKEILISIFDDCDKWIF